MKTAIVTGATGQDGSYAAELLLAEGYRVVGTTRDRAAAAGRFEGASKFALVEIDLSSTDALRDLIVDSGASEFYNFAAFSSGSGMFDRPEAIGDVNGMAVTRMLEAIRRAGRDVRFCQASSSEMFGRAATSPQNEDTPFRPRSPYGAAKLYAHAMIDVYRTAHGLFACSAILFNHESPRRASGFVTRKITRAAAAIKLGLADEVSLGNLDARRDWGFAGDYVEAMVRMLRSDAPRDYVVATGVTHSVRELCELAFAHVGLDYSKHVREDSAFFRPDEPFQLVGDASRAARHLRWSPMTSFEALVGMMVDADLANLSKADHARSTRQIV